MNKKHINTCPSCGGDTIKKVNKKETFICQMCNKGLTYQELIERAHRTDSTEIIINTNIEIKMNKEIQETMIDNLWHEIIMTKKEKKLKLLIN